MLKNLNTKEKNVLNKATKRKTPCERVTTPLKHPLKVQQLQTQTYVKKIHTHLQIFAKNCNKFITKLKKNIKENQIKIL